MSEQTAPPRPVQQRSERAPTGPLAAPPRPDRLACVGLPVQYMNNNDLVAGILLRESRITPGEWDLAILLPGGMAFSQRSAVKRSDTPRSGFWSFLPV